MVATVQEALDLAGSPPPGYVAMPVDFGHSVLGPPPPIEIVDNVVRMKPRTITSYPDWRVWFVPESAL
jgi:hypothetical protein